MKRIIPIMIVATMLFAVFIVITDTESEATIAGTYINGQSAYYGMEVDNENEHWKYDRDGLRITGDSVFSNTVKDGNTAYCICGEDFSTLKIILDADLLINAYDTDSSTVTLAVYTSGNITITGSGKLTIKYSGSEHSYIYQGLTAGENILIDGPTVEIWSDYDVTASQFTGYSFTMNSGELNLFGSGTVTADNIYIRGGTINVNACTGSIRDVIYAYSMTGDATLEMTGGVINFFNKDKGNDPSILSSLGGKSSNLKLHDAAGTNWKMGDEDWYAVAIESGPVTVEFNKSIHRSITRDSDEPLVLGLTAGCAALATLIVLISVVAVRKK